jgi:hypothetical protein
LKRVFLRSIRRAQWRVLVFLISIDQVEQMKSFPPRVAALCQKKRWASIKITDCGATDL